MTTAYDEPLELRNAVSQKPVTEEMLRETHGRHNFAEFREVIDAASGRQENLHFWARYGLTRYLGRLCRHLGTSLRYNCSSIAIDEYEQWIHFLRVAWPMLKELETSLPGFEDYVIRVQDYTSLNRLLSQDQVLGGNVLHWARVGVFEGVDSWRHMSKMVLSGKMPMLPLRGVAHEPDAFLRHAELLLAAHRVA